MGGRGFPTSERALGREAGPRTAGTDRKSTRLNSSHSQISYAVFCLKNKTKLVREAIDELLKQARGGDSIVMNSSHATTTFTAYQFRLFQLMPALKPIDPLHLAALMKEEPQTSELLTKYPQGQQSVDPWLRDTPMK